MERIPFCSPSISERDVQYVSQSVPQCATEQAGDYQTRFEQAFANYLHVPHAFAVSSRTAATHVALAALGVAPGDEVIVPEIIPAASLEAIRYLGATAVFADIDADTWCLSTDSVRQSLTRRTRVLLPVDLYGNLPEMHRLRALARARNISILEDASDALGGTYLDRAAGTLGDVGIFSFDRAETLTSGEGGMVVTRCSKLAACLQAELGDARFDYQISPMQAAMGLAQLERIEELVARKQQVCTWYRDVLSGTIGVQFSRPAPGADCVANELAVRLELPAAVARVLEDLGERGIDCRRMHQPGSSLPEWRESLHGRVARGRNRASYAISSAVVSLPSGSDLTRPQVQRVALALRNVLSQFDMPAAPGLRRAA